MADDELLDCLDADGQPLGVATRAAVHAGGLWHRTLHLWLAETEGAAGDGALLFQLRAASAANWPGLLDVSVAGHLLAGETYLDGFREAREEIGLTVDPARAVPLGIRRESHPDPAGGYNRELQGTYIAAFDGDWSAIDLVDGEAAGLFRIANADGLRLHTGTAETIRCEGIVARDGTLRRETREVTVASFVPRPGYYARMHEVAEAFAAGAPLPSPHIFG